MKENKSPKKQSVVSFKPVKIEKIKFFENDPKEIDFKKTKADKINTKIHTKLEINEEKKTIGIILEIGFVLDNDSNKSLFGIKTKHIYKIKNFPKIVNRESTGVYKIPDNFLAALISIAYSGTRGMLTVLVTNTEYKNIILPIIDPKRLLPRK